MLDIINEAFTRLGTFSVKYKLVHCDVCQSISLNGLLKLTDMYALRLRIRRDFGCTTILVLSYH
jgi:hypothetical protein